MVAALDHEASPELIAGTRPHMIDFANVNRSYAALSAYIGAAARRLEAQKLNDAKKVTKPSL